MVSRAIVASVLVAGTLVPTAIAMSGDKGPGQQSAMVRFERPTWVAGEILIGTYVIAHDEDKMARGEPCTTFYRVGTPARPLEEVVSFQCIPHERRVASSFMITVNSKPAASIDTLDTLTEYQFAGDSEGHGVPIGGFAAGQPRAPAAAVCAR